MMFSVHIISFPKIIVVILGIKNLLMTMFAYSNLRLSATSFKDVDGLTVTLDVTNTGDRAGKEIVLTGKEYALLEYLMRNAGSLVTRTMISEHVWDINFDTFTNVIDVYINYLRGKIDQGAKLKLIHTVRGRGYMIKE